MDQQDNMSFESLMRRIKRLDETYTLQKKKEAKVITRYEYVKDEVGNVIEREVQELEDGRVKDGVGNIPIEWEDIQILEGVIQHKQDEEIVTAGEQSDIYYSGFFESTFKLETDALSDYRVKFERPYETIYLKILQYDPNNYLRYKQHHIELTLKEDRKYET